MLSSWPLTSDSQTVSLDTYCLEVMSQMAVAERHTSKRLIRNINGQISQILSRVGSWVKFILWSNTNKYTITKHSLVKVDFYLLIKKTLFPSSFAYWKRSKFKQLTNDAVQSEVKQGQGSQNEWQLFSSAQKTPWFWRHIHLGLWHGYKGRHEVPANKRNIPSAVSGDTAWLAVALTSFLK